MSIKQIQNLYICRLFRVFLHHTWDSSCWTLCAKRVWVQSPQLLQRRLLFWTFQRLFSFMDFVTGHDTSHRLLTRRYRIYPPPFVIAFGTCRFFNQFGHRLDSIICLCLLYFLYFFSLSFSIFLFIFSYFFLSLYSFYTLISFCFYFYFLLTYSYFIWEVINAFTWEMNLIWESFCQKNALQSLMEIQRQLNIWTGYMYLSVTFFYNYKSSFAKLEMGVILRAALNLAPLGLNTIKCCFSRSEHKQVEGVNRLDSNNISLTTFIWAWGWKIIFLL